MSFNKCTSLWNIIIKIQNIAIIFEKFRVSPLLFIPPPLLASGNPCVLYVIMVFCLQQVHINAVTQFVAFVFSFSFTWRFRDTPWFARVHSFVLLGVIPVCRHTLYCVHSSVNECLGRFHLACGNKATKQFSKVLLLPTSNVCEFQLLLSCWHLLLLAFYILAGMDIAWYLIVV